MKARGITLLASLICASALATGCAEDDDGGDGHGTVRVNLQWSDAAQTDPFVGTVAIDYQVNYDRAQRCLLDFYLATDTSFQQNGVDGAPVFEDWEATSRVCTKSVNTQTPDCEVAPGSLTQFFSDQSPDDPSVFGNLRQSLIINDANLTNRDIAHGPLPTRDLLDSDCPPKVDFIESNIVGLNADGEEIWRVSSRKFDEMITDQGAAGLAEVARRTGF